MKTLPPFPIYSPAERTQHRDDLDDDTDPCDLYNYLLEPIERGPFPILDLELIAIDMGYSDDDWKRTVGQVLSRLLCFRKEYRGRIYSQAP